MIPDHLLQDRYWRGLLHIFMNHNKLKQLLSKPEFVDFEELTVHVDELIKASKGWSPSERFMLTCALNLFNGINKIDLSQADRLDDKSTAILREALQLRLAR
ncbi:hypothetical protein [Paenibacillus sp. FSL R10-2778]|uniref:hypothetical protein n=1 Tax=Paenibacillus sp. FSL R10-2778 TaxID=2954659 RepID=UPI00315838BF